MFEFNQPFDSDGTLSPAEIRESFSELCFEHRYPFELLDKLASFLPADTLREFLDDLATGRV